MREYLIAWIYRIVHKLSVFYWPAANNGVIQPPIPASFFHSPLPHLPLAGWALCRTVSSFAQLLIQVQMMGWEEQWWCHLLIALAGHRLSVSWFLLVRLLHLGWSSLRKFLVDLGPGGTPTAVCYHAGIKQRWVAAMNPCWAWFIEHSQPNSEILVLPLFCPRTAYLASALCLQNYVCEEDQDTQRSVYYTKC